MTNEELILLKSGLLDLVKLIEGILHGHSDILPVVGLPTTIAGDLDNGTTNFPYTSSEPVLNPQSATITNVSNPSAPPIAASSYVTYNADTHVLSLTVGDYLTPGTNYLLKVPAQTGNLVQQVSFTYMGCEPPASTA
jgi:hypothetical protein